MIDTQKTAVLSAMAAASEYLIDEIRLDRACAVLGIDPSSVHISRRPGMRVSLARGEISASATPMTVLHMLAHMATPSVFPHHGAEFCENLIAVTESVSQVAADALRESLDASGAHYTPDHRRRAVIKAVVQRAVDGTSRVEAVFSSPPQRVEGAFNYDRRGGTITINEEQFDLERLRYLSRVS